MSSSITTEAFQEITKSKAYGSEQIQETNIFFLESKIYVARTRHFCHRTGVDTTPTRVWVRDSRRIRSTETGFVDQIRSEMTKSAGNRLGIVGGVGNLQRRKEIRY